MNDTRTGPAVRAVCRVRNRSSCGSGSVVGRRGDKSLIMTNAHVAGTRVGRLVSVDVEATGERIPARVIMAGYSDRVMSDWAILETVEPWSGVEPVYCSRRRPFGSHYTKGFPRCQAHSGTDIETVAISDGSPVWRWKPNAIPGQSGSGVWSDKDHLQRGLLTWSIGGYGAGQYLAWIYQQAKERAVFGFPRIPDMIELLGPPPEEPGEDDPVIESGFFSQVSIAELEIWYEDLIVPPEPDPDDPDEPPRDLILQALLIERERQLAEFHRQWRSRFEGYSPAPPGEDDGGEDDEGDGCGRPKEPDPFFGL